MLWILGWDVYSNGCKEKYILEFAHFLDLTVVLVSEHCEVLYEPETQLLIIQETFISKMEAVSHLQFAVAILTDNYTGITSLKTSLSILKENAGAL